MTILFTCPTRDPYSLIPKIETTTPRLDGIMSALRSECLHVVSTIYREIPTKDTPVLTDLLHAFQKGEREDVSDLRLEFPEIPDESFECSPESWETIGGIGEHPSLFETRVKSAIELAHKLGQNVLIVAPVQVIEHLTGTAIREGDVLTLS